MSITNPTYPHPGNVSIPTRQDRALYNDLNALLPKWEKDIISRYGAELAIFLEMMGNAIVETRTSTRQFDHAEWRRLRNHVTVNANVTGATAGTSRTITLTSGDHFSSGTESSPRVGDNGRISSTGVWFKVTAKSIVSASAHTITIAPVNTADALTSSGQASTILANEKLLISGNNTAGEASTRMDGVSPLFDILSNTTTECRDDYPISDRAIAEQIKYGNDVYGSYYEEATTNLNKRMLHLIEDTILEGRVADNVTGTVGTLGLIPRVIAGGGSIGYTAGSFGMPTVQDVERYLTFNGGGGTYYWLNDINQGQELDSFIDEKYNTAVDSTSKEVVTWGFKGINTTAFKFMFKNYKGFSPESSFGAYPAAGFTHYRSNFAVLIPQKQVLTADGKNIPQMQIVYQEMLPGVKMHTFETGGMAPSNKTTTMERIMTSECWVGARVFGANQYAVVRGS